MAKKILLIEDEKILAEMYREKFTQAGFEVFLAFDAKEGLELAKKEKPDLIVLDILLPKENGITFLSWLRKELEISSIPVVTFSNYDDPETKREAFRLGVKDYLIKTNYTPSEVVAKVKQLLSEG
jgi:DNA-binding response OmpR family regulator